MMRDCNPDNTSCNNAFNNIILIGMPGTGKSTVGKLLGEHLGFDFIDTDQLITDSVGKTPRQLVEESGRDCFLRVQDEVVLNIGCNHCVIATGGGLVHSNTAMKHLKTMGKVIFLNTSYEVIEERMDKTRNLVRSGGSLQDLYNKRMPLYMEYADTVIDCDNTDPHGICKGIKGYLGL
ncbi:MAG: shikimate kinase [Eubacterium sp.]|jgi:shikimate kinase|nr:shikimate kinase [Eubacterium sp.]